MGSRDTSVNKSSPGTAIVSSSTSRPCLPSGRLGVVLGDFGSGVTRGHR